MSVQETIKLEGIKEVELVPAVKKRIETFVKDNEFWDKYVNHIGWDEKAKEMTVRRQVKPRVKKEEVTVAVEDKAPRPQKIAFLRFKRTINDYRDRINYTREDVKYGYDDIVGYAGDALGDITTQKLDIIKGTPFFNSACVMTAVQSSGADKYLLTLDKAQIILKKNKAKPYANNRYLAFVTPEGLQAIRNEIEAKGFAMAEVTKEEIAQTGCVAKYGKWYFVENAQDCMYDTKNSGKVNLVMMGRRPDGTLPIDCAKKHSVEVIHNPLGTGVLTDADGNITDDANKQRGSIAVNIDGLGCYVNDDLCVIDCEIATTEIRGSDLPVTALTGYDAKAPENIEITISAGTNTVVTLTGATKDTDTGKWYATPNTIIKAVVTADTGKTLGDPATGNFTVTSNKGAKVIAELQTTKAYDTALIELTNGVKAFTLTSTVIAS